MNLNVSNVEKLEKALKSKRQEILDTWEAKVRNSVTPARYQNHPILIDHLPLFMERIAHCSQKRGTSSSACEDCKVCSLHGTERADIQNYSIEQILLEYSILRTTIVQLLEKNHIDTKEYLKIIHDSIDQAMRTAGQAFTLNRTETERKGRVSAEKQRDQFLLEKVALESEKEISNEFVTNLSHDLRNPISNAKMALGLLQNDFSHVTGEKKMFEMVFRNLNRAENMLCDLLNINRLKTGQCMRLNLKPTNFSDLVNKTVGDLITLKGERFLLQVQEKVCGIWEESKLQRVLDNLIENAIKYGNPDSKITLCLKQNLESTTLSIHNSGNAIALKDQQKIFEPFFRVNSADGSTLSWGIGLALVKTIVESHQGIVSVDSSPSTGTTFTVVLPNNSVTA
jgi:signal transduction histidine kinase